MNHTKAGKRDEGSADRPIDGRDLSNALGSPLRLRLVAEIVGTEPRPLTLEEVVLRAGCHRQDVQACLSPMLRWGVLRLVEDGYQLHPELRPDLRAVIDRKLQAGAERVELERKVRSHVLGGMIGADPKMQMVFEMIRQVARIDVPVLVTGETGTGKELVARAVHEMSPRRMKAFGAVNCATLTEELFASQMFGHVKGAFTGAVRDHKGLFERCHQGTVFLDEVGDLSLVNQVRLLRVLQERVFSRVGDETNRESDFRIICATNRDLGAMVADGSFREDLFYRLNVFPMRVPSLRERPEDVPILVADLLAGRLRSAGRSAAPSKVSAEAMALLEGHEWPGNVRELENVLTRALILAGEGDIEARHLPGLESRAAPARGAGLTVTGGDVQLTLEEVERAHIARVLSARRGNVSAAAASLGISRTTLYKKMADHGIPRPTGHTGRDPTRASKP